MKIVIVGATGTLGQAVSAELGQRHELVRVGHTHGELQCDITDTASIRALFERIGPFDALVSTTGSLHFAALAEMHDTEYRVGLDSKLMGQVNLVLIGRDFIGDGGSFTLTSGVLNEDPIRFGSSASMVNAAVEGFVRGAAIELPRGLRINAVSPTVVEESMPRLAAYFRGYQPVSAARAALAYAKSVEGAQTGQVYRVW